MHRAHVLTQVQSCLTGARETAAAAAKDLQIPELALIEMFEKRYFRRLIWTKHKGGETLDVECNHARLHFLDLQR